MEVEDGRATYVARGEGEGARGVLSWAGEKGGGCAGGEKGKGVAR